MIKSFTLLLAGLLLVPPAQAHSGIHERLEIATDNISENPQQDDVYIQRAYLLAEHGAWQAAFDDLYTAEGYAPKPDEIAYHRAKLLHRRGAMGDARAALHLIDRYVGGNPEHANALLLRARLNRELQQTDAALADYAEATRVSPAPTADVLLEHAELLEGLGRNEQALRVLYAGLEGLAGPPLSLFRAGIRLEQKSGDPRAALVWFQRLPALLQVLPNEMLLEGDLLRQAGETVEAHEVYCDALERLSRFPKWRQQKPAFVGLERILLERTAAGSCGDMPARAGQAFRSAKHRQPAQVSYWPVPRRHRHTS